MKWTLQDPGEWFEESSPSLLISTERIEAQTAVGENIRGKIKIETTNGRKVRGSISVSEARIVPELEKFSGMTLTLVYGVDVTGLIDGDSVDGNILLSTNLGEYTIPVHVEIRDVRVKSSAGEIRDLAAFANLAKENYEEAFRLFTGPSFAALLEGEDAKHLALYRGLIRNPVTYHRMEEFLVGCGLKEPVSFTAEKTERDFTRLRETKQDVIKLRRSTWGSLKIDVEADADFIELPKKKIYGEDFVGSVYNFAYIIRYEKLGRGKRYGKITLRSFENTVEITVNASTNVHVPVSMDMVHRRNRTKLTRHYMDYEMDKIDRKEYIKRTRSLLNAIRELDDYPVIYALYESYIEDLSGDKEAAGNIIRSLSGVDFRRESAEVKAAFMYMGRVTGVLDPNVDILSRVREWQGRYRESVILTLIYFRVEPDIIRTPTRKMEYLRDLYNQGSRSPILYLEAIKILRRDGRELRRLTPFMRHVLMFATRNGIMTEELAKRAALLSDNEKGFSQEVYHILAGAYEAYPSDEILVAICKLLMKGAPRTAQTRNEYFSWFELAVNRELRITKLFVFYVENLPDSYQKILPKPILVYFALNRELSDQKTAFVYANVIRNKDLDPQTYEMYAPKMREFALESLENGRMDGDYAAIYQEFIKDIRSRKSGESIARAIFTRRIFTDDPNVREVVVCHGELASEKSYQIRNGSAYIERYTDSAHIFFTDGMGKRHASRVASSESVMMEPGAMAGRLLEIGVEFPGLLLNIVAGRGVYEHADETNISAWECIADSPAFTQEFRDQAKRELLTFMGTHEEDESVNEYLMVVDIDDFARVDRLMLLKALIDRGFYEKAFKVVKKYGCEGLELSSLVKLVTNLIADHGDEEDEDLLLLTLHTYERGKFDENMLTYLADNYQGSLDTMLMIRRDARTFYVNTTALDEIILKRIVFVGRPVPEADEVLRSYVMSGGGGKAASDYISFISIRCLRTNAPLDDYAAAYIEEQFQVNDVSAQLWRIALLLTYSKRESLTLQQETFAETVLEECAASKLRFAFFKDLPEILTSPYQLEDRVFIEQAAGESDEVMLHYHLSSDEDTEYKAMPLSHMYMGIFSREFILFYGESLTYYVTVRRDDLVWKSEEHTVTAEVTDAGGRSRYQMINRILIAKSEGDTEKLKESITEYEKAEQVVRQLFTLEGEF